MADTTQVMTPVFRVSFPALFRARANKDGGDPKFGVAMLFRKGEKLDALKAAAKKAAEDKWGEKLPKNLKMPFIDQGNYEYEGYVDGAILIRTTSKQKPGVLDMDKERLSELDEDKVYAGCWAIAKVNAFAYDSNGNKGVSFGLQNLMKMKDDDPIGGRSRPEDDFADVEIPNVADADELFN